jgi:hypothetical protein
MPFIYIYMYYYNFQFFLLDLNWHFQLIIYIFLFDSIFKFDFSIILARLIILSFLDIPDNFLSINLIMIIEIVIVSCDIFLYLFQHLLGLYRLLVVLEIAHDCAQFLHIFNCVIRNVHRWWELMPVGAVRLVIKEWSSEIYLSFMYNDVITEII